MRGACAAAVLALILAAPAVSPAAEEPAGDGGYVQLRAAIHVSSLISGGRMDPRETADVARENGISVVVFTERDLMRWEYGQRPLRRIVRRRVEHPSIATYGAERYIRRIEHLRRELPDMVFIHGAESAPFYYWRGSPWDGNMEMHDWHKHILAIGMKSAEDYEGLPVAGNERALRRDFQPFLMWPVILVMAGAALAIPRPGAAGPARLRLLTGAILIAAGALFFVNNRPFRAAAFDQYHGAAGSAPYQGYIDYVGARGGLTFWAHPEAENTGELDGMRFETREHVADMLGTRGWTGFSVFYEGFKIAGKAGGVWDRLLQDYCIGARRNPVWAIAGLACEGGAEDMRKRINVQTVVLAREKSEEAVLEALGRGRCYAVRGSRSGDFRLDIFTVSDESGEVCARAGETLRGAKTAAIRVEGGFQKGGGKVDVDIVRNGRIIATYRTESPFRILHADGNIARGKSYYRLEIRGGGLTLVSNPVFAVVE